MQKDISRFQKFIENKRNVYTNPNSLILRAGESDDKMRGKLLIFSTSVVFNGTMTMRVIVNKTQHNNEVNNILITYITVRMSALLMIKSQDQDT